MVTFTFIGSFGHSYNLRSICDVARMCLERNLSNVRFVLAGDGGQFSDIATRATALTNVTLTGWIDQSDLSTLLARSCVGLAPLRSVRDAMPNKPFEYFAAGLPILSSLEGEMAQLIDRYQLGFSYADGDTERLYDLIVRLAGDESLRQAMGANARRLYETQFRAEEIYARYACHVEDVVGRKRRMAS
jgi:glycosyltransferase involved in cell wall biosynthesis